MNIENYKSKSQIARIKTEKWVLDNIYCPICGKSLSKTNNNTRVFDFNCENCHQVYQLKSQMKKIGKKLIGSEYFTFINAIQNDQAPNILIMEYRNEGDNFIPLNIIFIPKVFIQNDVIEKRKPLAATAKRAGWTGFNMILEKIPSYGKINILINTKSIDIKNILTETKRIADLYIINKEKTKWKIEILKIIDKLPERFSLVDIYNFEEYLIKIFPENNHIKAKIRQQLQICRDANIIDFVGRGKYLKNEIKI